MSILVTGSAGFIGSNFVLEWLRERGEAVISLDKLTYAGQLDNLHALRDDPRHVFVHGDIGDETLVKHLLESHRPRAILNLAAESHVDRSIQAPGAFVETNVVGTFRLLETARAYWMNLAPSAQKNFRFLHVSTDEVYGTLEPDAARFTETSRYAPNSPYSASKAAADHFVRAFHRTYGFPTLTTNCSNNFGPYQFPEKLIPQTIRNAIAGRAIPLYGDGRNIRDWIFVSDHNAALRIILERGQPGGTYNIGGNNELSNIAVVESICHLLDELKSHSGFKPHASLISYVADRPGHDRRYAIDSRKLEVEFGWKPAETFESGIRKTVDWYLRNEDWMHRGKKNLSTSPNTAHS